MIKLSKKKRDWGITQIGDEERYRLKGEIKDHEFNKELFLNHDVKFSPGAYKMGKCRDLCFHIM